MQRIGRLLLKVLELLGLSIFGTIVVASIVALRHMIATPQPLESILPGEARLYRWKHGHIYYKVLGALNAPPLVLLHTPGIGASAYEMRAIMEPLAQQYRVYAPDLLGFGLSDRPRLDYSAETYISLCHDFLADVVKQPATLVASRLSCNYAIAIAGRFPDLCERLVLISPTSLFEGEQGEDGLGDRKGTPLPGLSGEQGDRKGTSLPYTRGKLLWNLTAELVQSPVVKSLLYPLVSTRPVLRYAAAREQHLNYDQVADSDVDYMYATTHQFGAEHAPMAWLIGKLAVDVSPEFDRLQQPALIIWGAQALDKTHAIASRQHVAATPNTQMILIRDASVGVHEEYPAKVAANIREWREEGKLATSAKPATAVISPDTGTKEEKTQAEVEEPVTVTELPAPIVDLPEQLEQPAKTEAVTSSESSLEAYCVRCKKKTKIQNPQEVTMKNGRAAVQGTCEVCGTKVYRIGRL
jgi:pimeloyl-ACP methyl ester carboxylesterase